VRDERVATAQRSEVIGLLGRALDDGHLDMADHDLRVVAVGSATYASELVAQVRDLPPAYAWLPPTAIVPATRTGTGSGRASLVFGILSLPTAFCVIGGLLGIVAVVLSFRGERPRGMSPAMLGRVFGIVGFVLSLGALFSLIYALNNRTSP
jgi:hypothetical protein